MKPDLSIPLDFLEQLSNNNNREWFAENKKSYQAAREEVLAMITELYKIMGEENPEYLQALPNKSLFRIYRDMRFAKEGDKPYKDHFGVVLSPGGTKTQEPSIYLQISPSQPMLAAGLWRPQKEILQNVRQEIDYGEDEFGKIIAQISKKGWRLDTADTLKRAPRNYDEDHKNINYIKLKSFVVIKDLRRDDLTAPNFIQKIITENRALSNFNSFLRLAFDE